MDNAYEKEGVVAQNINAIIALIVGVGVAALVLIFVGTLGGQTYNLVQPQIDAITDDNIRASVKSGITSGFTAIQTTGQYLPLLVLAVIIFIVLGLVIGLGQATGQTMGGQGAL